jgi:ribosomal protein S6--L-glutamate ligase
MTDGTEHTAATRIGISSVSTPSPRALSNPPQRVQSGVRPRTAGTRGVDNEMTHSTSSSEAGSSTTRSSATQQIDVSAIREFGEVLLTSPARLCFIVEERYENDVMPGAVVDVLRSCGHHVDVLRPNGTVTDLWELLPTDVARYDAFVLKTVSEGPGLSLLDAAAAAGVTTVNDYRAIRLARDKAVAAVRARAAGIPFPKTWFAHKSTLLEQIPADMYPLVVKPNKGSSLRDVYRVDSPAELAQLAIDNSGSLLAQPYLPNPGHDVKLYNTGDEVFATVKRSPLHPGADVVEEQIPVTPELRNLARAVGRVFGLDIYGIDVVQTADGYMVLDINDFPSFGKVPQAAWRLARTVLRVTRRQAAARDAAQASAPTVYRPVVTTVAEARP